MDVGTLHGRRLQVAGSEDGQGPRLGPPRLHRRGRIVRARAGQVPDGGAGVPQRRCQGDGALQPMQDVEEAIKEAHRADKIGCVSYYVRPNPVRDRTIWADEYIPLWSEVEQIGKPISTHESASSSVPSFGDRMDTHVSGHILSHPFEAMAAMAGLIWFGVFEKLPNLKVIHVEADGGWVPYWLQRMEQHWKYSGNA